MIIVMARKIKLRNLFIIIIPVNSYEN